nr:RNA binding protein 5 [Hymenolepis microstoma]
MSHKRRRPLPREANEEEKSIIICVNHCARELDDILQGARRKAQGNSKLFADKTASSLFRGMKTYQNMYSKLKLKSRNALNRLFQRSHDLEDMVDARDCIEETEDCWRQFLSNLDSDVHRSSHGSSDSMKKIGDFIDLCKPKLVDCSNFKEITLQQVLSKFTSSLLVFLPSYLPDTAARCRHSEISKVIADFYQLNAGFAIITWGPEPVVKPWSSRLLKHVKWPVLWDRDNFFTKFLSFKRGCARLWAPEMLDFCAYQNYAYNRTPEPLPLDIDWSEWNYVGGEVVIASPAATRMFYHRDMDARLKAVAKAATAAGLKEKYEREHERDSVEEDFDLPPLPLQPDTASARICYIHRADNIADMALPGSIYQSALTCFAVLHKKTETEVVEDIRTNRRLATPPENARLQYEAATGLYYDPETELHYDSRSGYFYDAVRKTYYYWSAEEHRYIPANELVKAQQEQAHKAAIAAAQEAAMKAVREQEAARAAAARVSAQLAALGADKDEYASYALSTCLLDNDDITSVHASYSTNIQQSLQQLGGTPTSSYSYAASQSSRASDLYPPGCPPPPGT